MKKLIMMLLVMMPLVSNATKVGVLDSPVWCNHTEFKSCESYWLPQFGDTYLSHHGTAVAGVIAGKTTGVSPNAELVTFDLFYHPNDPWQGYWIGDMVDGGGMTVEQSAVWFAKTHKGVTVFNQSYGDPSGVIHQDQINLWNANQDVLFVNAAGNNGRVVPPAPLGSNVILVGAVDKNNKRAPWSNIPGHGNKYHWVVAPGVAVKAPVAIGGNGYMHVSGTSFAAPYVTGVVAELQDRFPALRHNPAGTKNVVLTTATDLGPKGVDATYGWGLVNLQKAVLTLSKSAHKKPNVNTDIPYVEVDPCAGRDNCFMNSFAFQFIPNEDGELGIPNMRYYWSPELSLGYLNNDSTLLPSLNYSQSGFSVTLAYDRIDDQDDVYYSPMLMMAASYTKSWEMTKKSHLEFDAEIPMHIVNGYAQMDNETMSYRDDPNYAVWLRFKARF